VTASAQIGTLTGTWEIDPAHSFAEFAVRHMMVATAKGRFTKVAGTIKLDEANPAASSVDATIETASIDTGQPQRDAHLRTDDFFNAEQHPQITFRSTRVESVDDTRAKVYGDLTIRDVTKEVPLEVEFLGQIKDPYGKQRAGFVVETTINRLEFGLKWNALLETGGAVVSDRVRVTLNIEATKQQ
jgi:polyisoprenoid-binding protein YceI